MERKEGWFCRDQGGEEKGGERRREEGGLPQLVASILRRAELPFIKRAPEKIKLKIDVASKHPAPGRFQLGPPLPAASFLLPPSAWPSARPR